MDAKFTSETRLKKNFFRFLGRFAHVVFKFEKSASRSQYFFDHIQFGCKKSQTFMQISSLLKKLQKNGTNYFITVSCY